MPDSMQYVVTIDDMPTDEYVKCAFPWKPDNSDESRAEFFEFTWQSPLVGAGFKITPFGVEGRRHGRIAGYQCSINIPACTVGHNREFVNGVYWGSKIGFQLLRHFLATCGCNEKGLSHIKFKNMRLGPITHTFFKEFLGNWAATRALNEIRTHGETLLNIGVHSMPEKELAYTWPENAIWPQDTFTFYVRQRGFRFAFYVKEPGVKRAFLKKIDDTAQEDEVQERSTRTLRSEVTVFARWLADNSLDRPEAWFNNPAAYEKTFNLIRETLRLDDTFRTKGIKKTTIHGLGLPRSDKACLLWHVAGKNAYEHPAVQEREPGKARSKFFSAICCRIYDKLEIDLHIPWENQQKRIFPHLSQLLIYPGEYQPPAHLLDVVYSRVSAPAAYKRLEAMVRQLLRARKGMSDGPPRSSNAGSADE